MSKIAATVTILTYNSEKTLEACLESVKDVADILVLDGGSTDRTRDIAASFGARVLAQSETPGPIRNFTDVRVRSFELALHDWILWIDSDEWADARLIASIRDAQASSRNDVAYRAERFPVIGGRVIRYSALLPDRVLRFVHRGSAQWAKGKRVHEHLNVLPGTEVKDLAGGIYTPWQTCEEYRKKDRYYLHLAFSDTGKYRPSFRRTLHSIAKNCALGVRVLFVATLIHLRYGRTGAVMPWSYEYRFTRYYFQVARERVRQFFLGTSYVPPPSS